MDEIKVTSQQRFDLIDMTRLISRISEQMDYIQGTLLGNTDYYETPADDLAKRPFFVAPFQCTILGPATNLTIQVEQEWNDGLYDREAIVYGSDGKRLTGPNATKTKSIVVAAAPYSTIRYIQARRVPGGQDNNYESRHFYSDTAGHYMASVYTTNEDEWELQESTTYARTDPVAAAAGWIDIGFFQTASGPDQLTVVADYFSDFVVPDPFAWTTPLLGPDYGAQNIGTAILGLMQIVAEMRNGAGGLLARAWDYDPSGDARFEPFGGIQFGDGHVGVGAVVDTFLRARPGSGPSVFDQLTATKEDPTTLSVSQILKMLRAKGFFAGGAPGDVIDVATGKGYIYSDVVDECYNNPVAIDKYLQIDASGMLPGPGNTDPWDAPTDNNFYLGIETAARGTQITGASPNYLQHNLGWRYPWYWALSGSRATNALFIPLTGLPHGCLLHSLRLYLYQTGMHANAYIELWLFRRQFDESIPLTGIVEALNTPTQYNFPGAQYETIDEAPASAHIVDNENYCYYAAVIPGATGAINPSDDEVRFLHARLRYQIREASHVY